METTAFTAWRRFPPRRVLGVLAVPGALAAVIVGPPPAASATPPNCTAADIAAVAAGVSAATSAYLYTHPDVNAFFTGLEGAPGDAMRIEILGYLDANPRVRDEMRAIRQPLVDLRARCGTDTDIADEAP